MRWMYVNLYKGKRSHSLHSQFAVISTWFAKVHVCFSLHRKGRMVCRMARVLYDIYACTATLPVERMDLEPYGLRLLCALPLTHDALNQRRYLLVLGGPSSILKNSDVVFEVLHEIFSLNGGVVYSCQLVGYYFDKE